MTSCLLIGKNHALIYNFLTKEQPENLKKDWKLLHAWSSWLEKRCF
jgi:hypothetical protein